MKKLIKSRIFCGLAIIFMCLSLVYVSYAEVGPAFQISNENYGIPSTVNVGDIVNFGMYCQGNTSEKTPIEWKVIDVKDNSALLLSTYCIEMKKFDNKRWKYNNKTIFWQDSTIRSWLNNDFVDIAFSNEEKCKILYANIMTNDNNFYITKGNSKTTDRVFVLSKDEIELLLKNIEDRTCKPTKYIQLKDDAISQYWVRTVGGTEESTSIIDKKGRFILSGFSDEEAVRPAMWVTLDNNNEKIIDFCIENQFVDESDIAFDESVKAGDTVTMGKHTYKGGVQKYIKNISDKEPIKWKVIYVKDDKALLLSENVLFIMPYNANKYGYTWEKCSIREWLNDTFLNNAFSDKERKHIVLTDVPAHKNPNISKYYDYDGGAIRKIYSYNDKYYEVDTKDYIFIPSYNEIFTYTYSIDNGGPGTQQLLKSKLESWHYVLKYNHDDEEEYVKQPDEGNCIYFTRTADECTGFKICVDYFGGLLKQGKTCEENPYGIRPAMWVKVK